MINYNDIMINKLKNRIINFVMQQSIYYASILIYILSIYFTFKSG